MAYLGSLSLGLKLYFKGKGYIVALASGIILAIYTSALREPSIHPLILSLMVTSTISATLMDTHVLMGMFKGLRITGATPGMISGMLVLYNLLLALTISLPLALTLESTLKLATTPLAFITSCTLTYLTYRGIREEM